tara:strand:+ start:1232 stop:2545 length:1314 start_codon:yes stop_codon:yes gene_type:complete
MISNKKFKKILNDIKRRPQDAAIDLGISLSKINKYLDGSILIPFDLVQKCVKLWSINYNDFFSIEDDSTHGYKYMSSDESNKTARIMERKNRPYYLYKDTAYSRISPFKPEWIEELLIVDNNDPSNNEVVYNNGHFLHQFTYFIGDVNFYYIEDGVKKIAVMNTGDSMYISPYIPHSFATRKNSNNINGIILALTYADKLDHNCVDELNAIGKDLSQKYKLDLENKLSAFKSNLNYFLNVNSTTLEYLSDKLELEEINKIMESNNYPNYNIIELIAKELEINIRDLLPIFNDSKVSIKKYNQCNFWYFPNKKNPLYKFINLAGVKKLPVSKAFELVVNNPNFSEESSIFTPTHQYLYNIGNEECQIRINGNKNFTLFPNDSIYLKPNINHCFKGANVKLLVLRTGGKVSGDPLYHFSHVEKNQINRLIDDTKPWFNK